MNTDKIGPYYSLGKEGYRNGKARDIREEVDRGFLDRLKRVVGHFKDDIDVAYYGYTLGWDRERNLAEYMGV